MDPQVSEKEMTIKFYNPNNPETIYTLDGNLISWDDIYGERSHRYPAGLIAQFFDDGTWVQVEDEVDEDVGIACTDETVGAIASDGRSSAYYDIDLPDWLIDRVLNRIIEGRAYIKTEELIEAAFNDDFDAGNAFKSLVRLWGAFNGAGKAGNSVSYEKNKIEYSVGKLEQRYERKEEATDW
jgi:hypothetical protein